jgi:hypothetical protein
VARQTHAVARLPNMDIANLPPPLGISEHPPPPPWGHTYAIHDHVKYDIFTSFLTLDLIHYQR